MMRSASLVPLDLDLVAGCLDLANAPVDRLFWRAMNDDLSSLEPAERVGALGAVTGHVAESVAALLLEDSGFTVLWHHIGPGPHGVDLLMLDPTGQSIVAVEVKGTLQPRRWPRLTRAELDQMGAAWMDKPDNPGMAEWGLDSGDVYGCVLMIHFARRVWRAAVTSDFITLYGVRDVGTLLDVATWGKERE